MSIGWTVDGEEVDADIYEYVDADPDAWVDDLGDGDEDCYCGLFTCPECGEWEDW